MGSSEEEEASGGVVAAAVDLAVGARSAEVGSEEAEEPVEDVGVATAEEIQVQGRPMAVVEVMGSAAAQGRGTTRFHTECTARPCALAAPWAARLAEAVRLARVGKEGLVVAAMVLEETELWILA